MQGHQSVLRIKEKSLMSYGIEGTQAVNSTRNLNSSEEFKYRNREPRYIIKDTSAYMNEDFKANSNAKIFES
jgi:hypothetical protein